MLPKLIHKIWIGPNSDPASFSDGWKELFPEHKIVNWTNENLEPYFNKVDELLGGIPRITLTSASDLIRLLILKDHGGIYLDHDIQILKNFEHVLTGSEAYATFQFPPSPCRAHYKLGTTLIDVIGSTQRSQEFTKIHDEFIEGELNNSQFINTTDYVNNCFIASMPNSKFINIAIEKWINNYNQPDSLKYPFSDWGCGPATMSDAAIELNIELTGETQSNEYVTVYHMKHFHPVNGCMRMEDEDKLNNLINENKNSEVCYTIHHGVYTGAPEFVDSFFDNKDHEKYRYSYLTFRKNYEL